MSVVGTGSGQRKYIVVVSGRAVRVVRSVNLNHVVPACPVQLCLGNLFSCVVMAHMARM